MREQKDIAGPAGMDADQLELLAYLLEEEGVEGVAHADVIQPLGRAAEAQPTSDARRQLPLSFAQQRLWFLDQFEPGRAAYNMAGAMRMKGRLDVAALGRSLDEIVRRHEALRTSFVTAGGGPVQVVAPSCRLALAVEELTAAAGVGRDEELRRVMDEEARRPFDLRQSPLLRARLLRLGDEEHVLLLTLHHIVTDAWSMGVFARELAALYGAFVQGRPSPLEELTTQYGDYAAWQRERLAGDLLESQLSYWREQLGGPLPVLELPSARPRSPVQTFHGATRAFDVPAQLREELRALAHEEEATLFMALLAAFQVLLWRYTRQADILVGTPIAGRTRAETEPLIGCFVNTLVMRTRLSAGQSFRELLRSVRETCLGAYAHQEVPFERVVEELQPERSLSHAPLFQVMFTMQNAPPPTLELPGLELSLSEAGGGAAKFDLSLEVIETPEGLRGLLHYSTDVFDDATAARMAAHLQTLLRAVAASPDASVARLPLLTGGELQRLLVEWNATAADYPRGACVHELFEAQAAATPDAVALEYEDEQLSYAELNRRANQLARHLKGLGVGPEVRVGVMIDRSPELVVALLGILKAGGAYVPLDPANPPERLAYMIDDAALLILLTQERHLDAASAPLVVCLDTDWQLIGGEDDRDPPPAARAENLAYCIYTSGSTGTPKGVCVSHRAVARLVKNTNYTDFTPGEVSLAVAPVSFDASTVEIWGALLNGGRLALLPQEDSASLEAIGAAVKRHRVTKLWLTAGLFHLMVDYRLDDLREVSHLMAGGDVLSVAHVERFVREAGGCRLSNCYGPTENTTFTTTHLVGPGPLGGSVPIGRPISNTRVYILDEQLEPVAVGVVGELYAGGDGLARGYLNEPRLTAEKFTPDPFGAEAGGRLYRTGDLARYAADGTIEFVGRRDQQVKVRGFRVELDEINTALCAHPSVRECLVLAREDTPGDKRLVAYLVAARGDEEPPTAARLREHLRERLPEYMTPSAFVWLAELPLTANGKVDRDALPAPEHPLGEREHAYVAPRDEVEEALAAIFSDVLGVAQVGVHDNFFELGGHSLLATQVVTRVREVLHVDVSLRQFFETPVVAELASWMATRAADGRAGAVAPLVPASRGRALPLSFAQQRLWFLDQFDSGNPLYNIPTSLRLRGRLDVAALERALNEIVRRHESLRTVFRAERGEPVQVVLEGQPIAVPLRNLAGLPEAGREAEAERLATEEAQRGFDLGRGPLLRATLLRLGAEEHILLFTMHHIVSDGWSMGVLVEELGALYAAYASGRESPLAELQIQYADFAVWQRGWLRGAVLEEQLSFWKRQLHAMPPALRLPADRPRPEAMTYRGATIDVALPRELTEKLKSLSRREGVTLYMTLLAAFQALLHRYTAQTDIAVGSPIANRQRSEIEPLIGFFVNTLVMRTDLSGDPTFRELLGRVHEVTLGAYGHQDVPFEMLVEELQPERSLSLTPFFQTVFALQNAMAGELRLPGLTLSRVDVRSSTAKFDLSLLLEESDEGLTGLAEYSIDLFDEKTIRRLLEHFGTLLEEAVANPDERLSALPLLDAAEGRRLIARWSEAAAAPGAGECVQDLFERQAAAAPDDLALVFGEQKLTYGELNRRADEQAGRLQALGVGPEVVVAVMLERSAEALVGVLAVLKAGGAYLPIDPADPRRRIAHMLRDAAARVVLTRKQHGPLLPDEFRGHVLYADEELQTGERGAEASTLSRATADNLACLTYTPGAPGRPKAVGVRHGQLVNLLRSHAARDGRPAPRTLQLAPLTHDLAFEEIFSTWCAGGTLVLAPEKARKDSRELLRVLSGEKIERLFLHASRLGRVAELAAAEKSLPRDLREVITAGEQLRIDAQVRALFGKLNGCTLEHHYSLPETQLVAAWRAEGRPSEWPSHPPTGRPVTGAQVFVLDSRLRPVPAGVAGELYVGGEGLAREYLSRGGETAGVFIPNPFGGPPGARLYRTGDVVRHLDDGSLQYVGRADTRATVRGFRVELGEVEAALRQHPAVRQAAVNAWEDGAGHAHLVAYVVAAAPGAEPSPAELRAHLRESLPDYMTPSTFLLLEDLPLARDGSVNRQALPAPGQEKGEAKEGHAAAPRTPTEETLAGIWRGVLKVGRVGREDNFFDLGGHSLLATQVMSGVAEAFRVEVPLRRLFEYPTVAELARCVDECVREDQGSRGWPGARPTRPARLPLSFAQQRLWFIHQLEPDNTTYNIATAIEASGPLDAGALGRSLSEILRRHEVLRTSFDLLEGQPVQVIAPAADFRLEVVDFSGRADAEKEEEKRRLLDEEARRPFDLRESPLLRARLLRLSAEEHVLLLTMHHIVSDGWSVGVLARELSVLYEAYSGGHDSPLPELEVQYADYAVWQRERLAGDLLESQLSYWREQLAGSPSLLELPTARPRQVVQTFRGASVPAAFPPELVARLKALGGGEGATLFMALLGAFQALLWRYTRQADILVGTPIAGRTRAETEPLIGFFVNTLVMRTRVSAAESFRELLRQVRDVCLGAYAHQEVPFERVVEELQPERSLSHAPLFQVMFALQNAPTAPLELARLKLTPVEIPLGGARFDLTFSLEETGGGLSGQLEYNRDLFDADAMARLVGHFRRLLESIVEDPEARLAELELLPEAERRELLVGWNGKARRVAPEAYAHQLFERQAELRPEAPAVVCGDVRLTYGELNGRANQLAHHLRALGVGPETPVCICVERSAEYVAAVLAVVKAGGAYVPLDPSYPAERLSFMLQDSRAPVLLTREGLRATFADCTAEVVLLDRDREAFARLSVENPSSGVGGDNLAYVIYTSGTTGRPKGVAITHASLANMIGWYTSSAPVAPGDRFTQLAGVGFDATVMELWPNLASGASCHLTDEETRLSPEKLRDWLVSERINTCFAPTPLAEMLLPLSWPPDTALRFLHAGGDKLHRFPDKSLGFRVVNNYGPTECTVLATSCEVDSEESASQTPPIGRPIDNAEVYLLDEYLRPVPAGVHGEVYVGGAGLARGYLRRPAQTAAAFIPHPFSASPGARLYRTGDLARHLPDGQIEFLGRLDGQVKVRGHRIELGEIEVALGAHAAVRGCVVDCREAPDGEKRLTAYLVPEEGARPGVGELRAYLAERLPGYMVPSAFVLLEALPLTANGKLDRRALPEADDWTAGADAAYVAPATEMERTVAGLWQELLGLEKVGVHDNFFDLGGHSLLMVRMQSRLREILRREVAVVELFKYPTVSTLAQHLAREPRGERDGAGVHRERAQARRDSVAGRAQRRQDRTVSGR